MTAAVGNASVYQVYPVSRITGEGRAEILRAWGHGFEQEGAGGGDGMGRATQSVRGNYKSFKGINLTALEGVHPFILYIYPVSRTTGEERAECSRGCGGVWGGGWEGGRVLTGSGRIDVGACCTRGARSR